MIDVVIEGVRELAVRLERIEAGLLDLSVPTQAALQIAADSVLENFLVGGRPEWAALRDGDDRPLFQTGGLAEAASATQPGVEGSTYRLAPDGSFGQIGVEDLFHGARRHDLGYQGPDSRGRTFDEEAREFMELKPSDEAAIIEVYDRYLLSLTE